MARNDSVLYTGLNGNKLEELAVKRAEKRSLKAKKRNDLLPVAEVVLEAIEKEKVATQTQLLSTITSQTTQDEVKDLIVALNLYSESLSKLRNKFNTILRKHDEL